MSLRKRMTTIAIAAGLASCAFAAQASASAKGIEPFRVGEVPTPFGTYPIPSGELDHGITGKGLKIESQKAGFSSMPPLCNYKVAYSLKNLDGVEYERAESELISDCHSNHELPGVEWNLEGQPGKACAILYADNHEIARQCHNVTRN